MPARSLSGSYRFRRARGVGGKRHDPYRLDAKRAGTFCCGGCGAVYHAGRWSWRQRPLDSKATECPACLRIRDRAPAGVLRLEGDFGEREEELRGLIRNVEERQKALHPLERLMDVRRERGALLVQTTGVHLARRIADALQRAFHRDARLQFLLEQELVRVTVSEPEAERRPSARRRA